MMYLEFRRDGDSPIFVPSQAVYSFLTAGNYADSINALEPAERRLAIERSPIILSANTTPLRSHTPLMLRSATRNRIAYTPLEPCRAVRPGNKKEYVLRAGAASKYLGKPGTEFARLKRQGMISPFSISNRDEAIYRTGVNVIRTEAFLLSELNAAVDL